MDTMRLLIAYDGSESARVALQDLVNVGLPPRTHATVVSIADMVCVPTGSAEADPALPEWLARSIERAHAERRVSVDRMRSGAQKAAEQLRRAFPGWTVSAEAFGDSPASGILKRADELRSDLIVVGSRGNSALEVLVLGSVSLQVMSAARCSVRIARGPHREPGSPLRLLVGVDGSSDSLAAVRAVKARAWPAGTQVRVVSALDAFLASAAVAQREEVNRWLRGAAEAATWVHAMAGAVAQEIRDAGLDAEGCVITGTPWNVLLDETSRWDADCVFLGSQGFNAVDRSLLGRVASAVAARATCSVEVSRS